MDTPRHTARLNRKKMDTPRHRARLNRNKMDTPRHTVRLNRNKMDTPRLDTQPHFTETRRRSPRHTAAFHGNTEMGTPRHRARLHRDKEVTRRHRAGFTKTRRSHLDTTRLHGKA